MFIFGLCIDWLYYPVTSSIRLCVLLFLVHCISVDLEGLCRITTVRGKLKILECYLINSKTKPKKKLVTLAL